MPLRDYLIEDCLTLTPTCFKSREFHAVFDYFRGGGDKNSDKRLPHSFHNAFFNDVIKHFV